MKTHDPLHADDRPAASEIEVVLWLADWLMGAVEEWCMVVVGVIVKELAAILPRFHFGLLDPHVNVVVTLPAVVGFGVNVENGERMNACMLRAGYLMSRSWSGSGSWSWSRSWSWSGSGSGLRSGSGSGSG